MNLRRAPASPGGEWAYTLIQEFHYDHPDSPLILRNGNLYGAIQGTPDFADSGALFELQAPATPGAGWSLHFLHVFTDGQWPFGSLLMDAGGTIYGVSQTAYDKAPSGTVFALATNAAR